MPKFEKGHRRAEGAGRKVGSLNKVTRELREVIGEIVDGAAPKLQGWLERVAKEDPAKAVELTLKMSEFVLPKISRIEHGGGLMNVSLSAILKEIDGKTAGLPRLEDIEASKNCTGGWGAD